MFPLVHWFVNYGSEYMKNWELTKVDSIYFELLDEIYTEDFNVMWRSVMAGWLS